LRTFLNPFACAAAVAILFYLLIIQPSCSHSASVMGTAIPLIRETRSEENEWISLEAEQIYQNDQQIIIKLHKAIPEECIRLVWDGTAAKSLPPRINFSLQQKKNGKGIGRRSKTFVYLADPAVLKDLGQRAFISINGSEPILLDYAHKTNK
jgi:hypothetical protein